ncbi:MAG TPA: right-handed parallel beta-helix repeat-containing protein [Candidatus Bathyarchaeia archaeon]|nr:right-handed parallel beta-helix repeat-containing protein [Candidatus Bathyarchaeia archaeon]
MSERSALADDCSALGGVLFPGECRVTTAVTLSGGPFSFSLGETLHITDTGKITIPALAGGNSFTLGITGGLVMDTPSIAGRSAIVSDVTPATGDAGNITITATGSITLHGDGTTGARISANQGTPTGSCSGGTAGNIQLTAGTDITTELGSQITADAFHCPAGSVVLKAGRDISPDGLVESKSGLTGVGGNQRPGGGPVTLDAGCTVSIVTGTIRSQGADPGANLVEVKGGCAVIILGLIESTGPGHVVPNNPANQCGQVPGKPADSTACIRIVSGGPLTIDSTLGNNGEVSTDNGQVGGSHPSWIDLLALGDITITGDTTTPFAVHANQFVVPGSTGGIITVKSKNGAVTASGLALEADSTQQDLSGPAPGGDGGSITVEANTNVTLDTASIFARGDFVPAGGLGSGGQVSVRSFNGAISWKNGTGDVRPDGTINLQKCSGSIDTTGSSFPSPGTPTTLGDQCTGMPDVSGIDFGTCACGSSNGGGGDFCDKSSVKAVLDPVSGRFPGNLGADTVVETQNGDSIQTAINTASDSNGDGYIIIGVVAKSGGVLGGNTSQHFMISANYDPLPFALIGCSVVVHDDDTGDGLPTAWVKSSAQSPDLFIMDLHAADSDSFGWLVEGDGRTLRNVKAFDNALAGIKFAGNGNLLHGGLAQGNGGNGILVVGNANVIEESDAFLNGDDGIEVDGNNNQILKNDSGDRNKGNGGDGIEVTGAGNLLSENDAFANDDDGFDVFGTSSSNPNVIRKSRAGDRGKGNAANGIIVGGLGNGKPNPVEIDENKVKGNGLAGIVVVGSKFELRKNQSGGSSGEDNGGCEFDVAAGNFNSKDNKANGVTVLPNTDGAPFPTGCLGTP